MGRLRLDLVRSEVWYLKVGSGSIRLGAICCGKVGFGMVGGGV